MLSIVDCRPVAAQQQWGRPSACSSLPSIRHRHFVDVIDHHHVQRRFGFLQSQPELLFQRGEQRGLNFVGAKTGARIL
jgi:hypothetical protein